MHNYRMLKPDRREPLKSVENEAACVRKVTRALKSGHETVNCQEGNVIMVQNGADEKEYAVTEPKTSLNSVNSATEIGQQGKVKERNVVEIRGKRIAEGETGVNGTTPEERKNQGIMRKRMLIEPREEKEEEGNAEENGVGNKDEHTRKKRMLIINKKEEKHGKQERRKQEDDKNNGKEDLAKESEEEDMEDSKSVMERDARDTTLLTRYSSSSLHLFSSPESVVVKRKYTSRHQMIAAKMSVE